jgi:hypothetical protein
MARKARFAMVALGEAIVALLLGCPSLSAIGVGGGDAGADRAPDGTDATRDARDEPDAGDAGRENDAPKEAFACTPDAASDPKNCGSCKHDCKGGGCLGGVCQPYAIVTGNEGPYGIAVHDGVVYFTSSDDTVYRCMADTCSDTLTQMTSGQQLPRRITTDATNVYWASEGFVSDGGLSGSIATCGLAGCPGGVPTVLAVPEQGPFDLVVDTTTVYWTTIFGKLVRSCNVSGCGNMPKTLSSPGVVLSGVAVDATSIYWAEPMAGNVIQCPLSGCVSPTPFASGQSNPTEVDVVNGMLYWSTSAAIMSCPTTGCVGAPAVFAKNQPGAVALAHDDTTLYWTSSQDGGQIVGCPLLGCTMPAVLANMQGVPTDLAVDDTALYWTNATTGTVTRVIK